MITPPNRLLVLCMAMSFVMVADGMTDEPDEDTMKAEVTVMAKKVSAQCEFSSGGDAASKFVQHPEAILRWSNPTAGSVFGEVYVWTDNGRPAVVASLFRWFSVKWGDTLEVCSLVDGPVSGRLRDVRLWASTDPGLQFKSVSDADAVAKSAPVRLVQMRRIANGFVAELADTRSTGASVNRQLRLLSQPVFRYPPPTEKSEYIDGALFTFVEGTDPEVLLLIEASQVEGENKWRYGLARMNRDALVVKYRETTVWTAPHIAEVLNRPREPYAAFALNLPLRDLGSKTSKGMVQP